MSAASPHVMANRATAHHVAHGATVARARSVDTGADGVLLVAAVSLMVIGLIAIASASIEHDDWHFGNPWYHTTRHLVYLALAGAIGAAVYRIPIELIERASPWCLILALLLLVVVLLPGIGRNVNGSQRWIPVGPLTIQPSEIAKAALVVYCAGYLVRHGEQLRSHWHGMAKPVAVLMLVAGLLMAEPDFGATVIASGAVFGMLFLAGAQLRYVALLVMLGVAALVGLAVSAPYRLERLTAYRDPWADPFDAGFQLIQSLIAYGRGELWGVGLGNSVQKLFYLPEAHTDFVFSIWAEETGMFGALAVLALYTVLVGRTLWIGRLAITRHNRFAGYVCYGFALIFAGQAFVNIGVSSGLLPTKGLTLPFISYGGSSLIVNCIMLAVILRISHGLKGSVVPVNGRRR